jgi:LmbE family N-acetylglucosaminyl deacetylase
VIAHPDDEVLGMGGRLAVLRRLTLIQLTDGSPRSPADRRRAGFATRRAYASAREREACHALTALGLNSLRRIRYAIPDQEAVLKLADVVRALERDLEDTQIVFTHPYEGGHPDHDAAAFAVQTACKAISCSGHPPPMRIEFASYHCENGRLRTGRFWPDAGCPELLIHLSEQAAARKRRALARHVSQRAVITWFDPSLERYRVAPRYDFTGLPPPGAALYDAFGWAMTSARWRRAVRLAMDELASAP